MHTWLFIQLSKMQQWQWSSLQTLQALNEAEIVIPDVKHKSFCQISGFAGKAGFWEVFGQPFGELQVIICPHKFVLCLEGVINALPNSWFLISGEHLVVVLLSSSCLLVCILRINTNGWFGSVKPVVKIITGLWNWLQKALRVLTAAAPSL